MSVARTDRLRLSPLCNLGILNRREQFVQLLLEYPGVDLNAVDNEGNTALHWSVLYEHLKLTYYLLMKGLDRTIRNNAKKRAEDIAKDESSKEILHLFVA